MFPHTLQVQVILSGRLCKLVNNIWLNSQAVNNTGTERGITQQAHTDFQYRRSAEIFFKNNKFFWVICKSVVVWPATGVSEMQRLLDQPSQIEYLMLFE